MKVENNGVSGLQPNNQTEAAQRVEKKTLNQTAHQVSQSRDTAEVSDKARLLSKARAAMETTPEEESEKVAVVREQVQNGTYKIHTEEIAAKLASGIFLQG
jgi:flagellar biosynthesis anti-sigma factor FlgM